MKIRHLTLAVIAVACGQAHALDPATSNAAATVKVYMSGATAMRNIIGGLFTENCVAGTRQSFNTPNLRHRSLVIE